MFRLTIEIPDYVKMEKKPPVKTIDFLSKEEKEQYVKNEFAFASDEWWDARGARSDKDVATAWEKMYNKRKQYAEIYVKNHTEKSEDIVA